MNEVAKEKLNIINKKIEIAANSVNRSFSEITVIGISKGQPLEKIRLFIESGLKNIGESYIQESEKKFQHLPYNLNYTKHFIGRLQTNKVKKAIHLFNVIVVDRLSLIMELNKKFTQLSLSKEYPIYSIPFPILLQINIGNEASKGGCPPEQTFSIVETINDRYSKQLRCIGLMTVAPLLTQNEKKQLRFFRLMKEHHDEVKASFPNIKELSMGMSNSFENAIKEGATMVRLGRILFGPRNYS